MKSGNDSSQEAASVDSYPATITKTDLENFMTHTDAITKDSENISQDSRAISDYLDSFSSLMVHPDGSLADLSDRDGRKDLNDNIKKNTEAVEVMSAKIAEAPQKMLEAIPESVKAEIEEKQYWRKLRGDIALILLQKDCKCGEIRSLADSLVQYLRSDDHNMDVKGSCAG